MLQKEIKQLYKELISDDIKSTGFNFLKSTSQEEFTRTLPLNKIPKSWKRIYFKLYPRFAQIDLKKFLETVNINREQLLSIIQKRKSERKFQGKSLTLEIVSQILYFVSGIRSFNKTKENLNQSKRMYPSAGARYPLEMYVVILRSKEVPLGIYHYNVKWNTLELLLKGNFKKEFSQKITNQHWIEKSGMVIIITTVFGRTLIKYKERGWRYIFFEAGHLTQNVYLISTLLKLKCCAIGGFIDKKIIKLLDLNPKSELPLYLIAIGS